MRTTVVGIDLGGTSIKGGLVSSQKGVLRSIAEPTMAHNGPSVVLDRIANVITDLDPDGVISAVGVGAPGSVNLARTTISGPPNFPGWLTENVADGLRTRLRRDIPILVENDANVAALGSAYFGAGKPYDDFIMVTLGTGVGGAIIHNNKIFRGSTGGAGEIGHMSVDYEGPVARSGVAGAIEAYIGHHFLSRHARDQIIARRESVLHKTAGEDLVDLTPKLLYDAAVEGDAAAQEVFRWAGHKLGCVLGSAVNLLDIRKIIVGGGQSAAGDFLLEPARETIIRYVTPALRDGVEIIRELRGNDIAILGAAQLAFDELAA